MTTPQHAPTTRVPLRLALADSPGRDTLDGGWWPQSRLLAVELADLVTHFPATAGRIVRVLCSPPDWDDAPRRVPVPGGSVKVGSFPRDDTHLVLLRTADRTTLRLLVVPPGLSEADGQEAVLAASSTGNRHDAGSLLRTVADSAPVDRDLLWTDAPA